MGACPERFPKRPEGEFTLSAGSRGHSFGFGASRQCYHWLSPPLTSASWQARVSGLLSSEYVRFRIKSIDFSSRNFGVGHYVVEWYPVAGPLRSQISTYTDGISDALRFSGELGCVDIISTDAGSIKPPDLPSSRVVLKEIKNVAIKAPRLSSENRVVEFHVTVGKMGDGAGRELFIKFENDVSEDACVLTEVVERGGGHTTMTDSELMSLSTKCIENGYCSKVFNTNGIVLLEDEEK